MAKITGFVNSYNGLNESEAWQRIYEFGKNLMPIKERVLQKKYNDIFNKNTKVVRDGILKKIPTDRVVPGDIVIIEKGDFVPADGVVIEEVALEFDRYFTPDIENVEEDKKIVYQGMKVNNGKATVEVIKTGDETYLGGLVKQIDNKNLCKYNLEKILHKYFNIIGVIGLILLVFGAVFAFITNKGDIVQRLSMAGYSGLLLFLVTVPLGSLIAFCVKIIEQRSILRKSNLNIKKYTTLMNACKASVICIDERFLSRNYEKYIQRFYSTGIMIAVITGKNKADAESVAKKAGVFDSDVVALSGAEIDNMSEERLSQAVCDTVIFYEINKNQKLRILEAFSNLGIRTINVVDDVGDLPTVKYADINIVTHNKRKNLEYEFSNANIIGTELTSVYSLIKGSFMIRSYLNHFIKYYIMFQLPVILSLLVALLSGLDLKVFYFQTLMYVIAVVPLMLLLVNKDYSEDKIFELKNKNKNSKFAVSCIIFGFVGLFVGVVCIAFYVLLSMLNVESMLSIGIITVLLTILDIGIVMLERNKFGVKPKDKSLKVEIPTEKTHEPEKLKEKKKKEKIPKLKKDKRIEEMRDEIL